MSGQAHVVVSTGTGLEKCRKRTSIDKTPRAGPLRSGPVRAEWVTASNNISLVAHLSNGTRRITLITQKEKFSQLIVIISRAMELELSTNLYVLLI